MMVYKHRFRIVIPTHPFMANKIQKKFGGNVKYGRFSAAVIRGPNVLTEYQVELLMLRAIECLPGNGTVTAQVKDGKRWKEFQSVDSYPNGDLKDDIAYYQIWRRGISKHRLTGPAVVAKHNNADISYGMCFGVNISPEDLLQHDELNMIHVQNIIKIYQAGHPLYTEEMAENAQAMISLWKT